VRAHGVWCIGQRVQSLEGIRCELLTDRSLSLNVAHYRSVSLTIAQCRSLSLSVAHYRSMSLTIPLLTQSSTLSLTRARTLSFARSRTSLPLTLHNNHQTTTNKPDPPTLITLPEWRGEYCKNAAPTLTSLSLTRPSTSTHTYPRSIAHELAYRPHAHALYRSPTPPLANRSVTHPPHTVHCLSIHPLLHHQHLSWHSPIHSFTPPTSTASPHLHSFTPPPSHSPPGKNDKHGLDAESLCNAGNNFTQNLRSPSQRAPASPSSPRARRGITGSASSVGSGGGSSATTPGTNGGLNGSAARTQTSTLHQQTGSR
jgi:hypothetical protein